MGTVKIGTTADDDGYLTTLTAGASSTPASKNAPGDWDGALVSPALSYPKIAKGTLVLVTITHASMVNPDCILTFLEG